MELDTSQTAAGINMKIFVTQWSDNDKQSDKSWVSPHDLNEVIVFFLKHSHRRTNIAGRNTSHPNKSELRNNMIG